MVTNSCLLFSYIVVIPIMIEPGCSSGSNQRGVGNPIKPGDPRKGFRKILLRPNQTRTVIFELSREKLSFTAPAHSHRHGAIVEPGKFLLWVAPSSSAGNPVSFELEAPPLI